MGLAVYECPCRRASTFFSERNAENMEEDAKVAERGRRPPVRILA
jgi:hypothetical protein